MTSNEGQRAAVEARRTVIDSTAPVSRHDTALQRYLVALEHADQVHESSPSNQGHSELHGDRPHGELPIQSGPVRAVVAAAAAASPDGLLAPIGSGETAAAHHREREKVSSRSDLVVVGIDTSSSSYTAYGWAAEEAVRRHAVLRLVHAYTLPSHGFPGYNPMSHDAQTALRAAGEEVLQDTAATLRASHPSLTIDTRLIQGDPVAALQAQSEQARLTVVGSRGSGRLTGLVLGSVAMAISSTNTAPVAVIHPHQRAFPSGPVVVGVDGSPTSEAAVAFAFEAAALRRTKLVAVHSWNDAVVDAAFPEHPILIDPAEIDSEERALLSERLAGWHEKYPDVIVEQIVVHGRPTPALLGYGESSELIVVGSRGRGGFKGMLLGSTSHALIMHSQCPVVVVRPNVLV